MIDDTKRIRVRLVDGSGTILGEHVGQAGHNHVVCAIDDKALEQIREFAGDDLARAVRYFRARAVVEDVPNDAIP